MTKSVYWGHALRSHILPFKIIFLFYPVEITDWKIIFLRFKDSQLHVYHIRLNLTKCQVHYIFTNYTGLLKCGVHMDCSTFPCRNCFNNIYPNMGKLQKIYIYVSSSKLCFELYSCRILLTAITRSTWRSSL